MTDGPTEPPTEGLGAFEVPVANARTFHLAAHYQLSEDDEGIRCGVPWSSFSVTARSEEEARRLFSERYLDLLRRSIEERDAVSEWLAANLE